MPRLTAGFWVQAYLRRLSLANIPAFVVHKGDETAGAVVVISNPLDGSASAFHRVYSTEGERIWDVLATGSEGEIKNTINKQRDFDPDLWVIEVEDRAGRHLLEEPGLS